MMTDLSEAEVRHLRDVVYGKPSGDANWQCVRDNWMRPDSIAWLKKHAQIKTPMTDEQEKLNEQKKRTS